MSPDSSTARNRGSTPLSGACARPGWQLVSSSGQSLQRRPASQYALAYGAEGRICSYGVVRPSIPDSQSGDPSSNLGRNTGCVDMLHTSDPLLRGGLLGDVVNQRHGATNGAVSVDDHRDSKKCSLEISTMLWGLGGPTQPFGSVVYRVRMLAFQAGEPGSIPGRTTTICPCSQTGLASVYETEVMGVRVPPRTQRAVRSGRARWFHTPVGDGSIPSTATGEVQ